jgi:hypothetical protein
LSIALFSPTEAGRAYHEIFLVEQSGDTAAGLAAGALASRGAAGYRRAVSESDIIVDVNRHQRTLESIFEKQAGIPWKAIESMLENLGAEIEEGRGSRVRIYLRGLRGDFHRPHPQKETDRGAVASMKRFLLEAGICPEDSQS